MADDEAGETAINYKIPSDLHARAKVLAARQGRSLKGWVTLAIAEAVERQEAEHAEAERRRRGR